MFQRHPFIGLGLILVITAAVSFSLFQIKPDLLKSDSYVVLSEKHNKGGKYNAVKYRYNPGATSDYAYGLIITKGGSVTHDDIVIVSRSDFVYRWKDKDNMFVENFKNKDGAVKKREYKGIKIEYEDYVLVH